MLKYFHILLFMCIASKANAQSYSMADLEVLQERKNYIEFFLHAKDIRPSNRGKPWKAMVQQMSEGYMRDMLERPFISKKDLDEVNKLSSWTTINENIGFLVLRNKFGVKYFKTCFENELNKQDCYKLALEFIKKTPDQSQMSTDIGHIIYLNKLKLETKDVIGMNLWPFFEQMAKTSISEFYCDKAYFRDEVVNQIYANVEELNKKKLKEKIETTAHKDCWKVLKGYFKQILYSSIHHQRINSYFILSAMSEIESYDNTRFLITHLLNYPSPGEIFDKAWKELANIGNDYQIREKLIADFKSMDSLPGKLFKFSSDKRSLVILKSFLINFPEYIDLYSQTCLKYFEGTENFPNGKPTLECEDWFKTAKTFKLLPDLTIKRFDAAKNFKIIKL